MTVNLPHNYALYKNLLKFLKNTIKLYENGIFLLCFLYNDFYCDRGITQNI